MNATNRAVSRTVLIIVGFAFLLAGVGAVLVVATPDAQTIWGDNAPHLFAALGTRADHAASVEAWVSVIVVAAIVGIAALFTTAAIGGGRTNLLVDDDGAAAGVPGSVRVESTAIQHALSSSIGALPGIDSLSIDVYRIRRRRALKITVRPRKGAAPREIVTRIEAIIADLDALLGTRLPVLIRLARGGAASPRGGRVR